MRLFTTISLYSLESSPTQETFKEETKYCLQCRFISSWQVKFVEVFRGMR